MKTLSDEATQTIITRSGLKTPHNPAFTLQKDTDDIFYNWHTHPYHQIIYAIQGTTQIEDPTGRHLLPTTHAIFVPALTPHKTLIRNLRGLSLFLDPADFPYPHPVRTFFVSPLLREMLLHALHWPDSPQPHGPLAQSFLQALGLLCVEQAITARPFTLPHASHPSLKRAINAALIAPGETTLAVALTHAGMSERNFRRHFQNDTGLTWQTWITQARIFHAVTLLSQNQSVTTVAADCGYTSLSAFAKAFTRVIGTPPARYRQIQKEI